MAEFLWDDDLHILKIFNVVSDDLIKEDSHNYVFNHVHDYGTFTIQVEMRFHSKDLSYLPTCSAKEFFKVFNKEKDKEIVFAFLFTDFKRLRSHLKENKEYVIEGELMEDVHYRATLKYKKIASSDPIVGRREVYVKAGNNIGVTPEERLLKAYIEHPYSGGLF